MPNVPTQCTPKHTQHTAQHSYYPLIRAFSNTSTDHSSPSSYCGFHSSFHPAFLFSSNVSNVPAHWT